MAMQPDALKAKMKERIYNGLKKEFSSAAGQGANYTPIADEHWAKIAEAISGVALDIVLEITQNAQVVPGIPVATVGGPSAQAGTTVGPGKVV